MRILLDHCIDWRLKRSLSAHQVKSAQEMGWEKLENGDLLRQAATAFDVVLTTDRSLQHQQNPTTLPLAVIVFAGRSNRLTDLIPLVPQLEVALSSLTPRTVIVLSP